jgi:hypothetical protein
MSKTVSKKKLQGLLGENPLKDKGLNDLISQCDNGNNSDTYNWISKKRGGQHSEFLDINRFIDFVANEEALKEKEPDTDKRAYLKYKYTLGE